MAAAERLLRDQRRGNGRIGVDVQPLTTAIAAATGATAGVVVTWVDPHGASADKLAAMDVIEAEGNEPMATTEHWRARVARLAPGDELGLRVRRLGAVQQVRVVAGAPQPLPAAPEARSLGLTMRTAGSGGAEIVRVDRVSVAALARIEPGDVITAIGDLQRPTPAQVTKAFAAAPDGSVLLVAITRGETHQVLALDKR
jgi:S1-C subfamily serine protease